jgi:hypothetical protein
VNEIIPVLNCDLSPELARAINILLVEMTPEKIVQLAELILDVKKDTRFGGVNIVIAEGRIQRLKAEKSYP